MVASFKKVVLVLFMFSDFLLLGFAQPNRSSDLFSVIHPHVQSKQEPIFFVDINKSIALLEKSIQQQPHRLDWQFQLGFLYSNINNFNMAQKIYAHILTENPPYHMASYCVFYIISHIYQVGHQEQTQKILFQLFEKGSISTQMKVLAFLACIYQNDQQGSQKVLDLMINFMKKHPKNVYTSEFFYSLYQVYYSLNKDDKAKIVKKILQEHYAHSLETYALDHPEQGHIFNNSLSLLKNFE